MVHYTKDFLSLNILQGKWNIKILKKKKTKNKYETEKEIKPRRKDEF